MEKIRYSMPIDFSDIAQMTIFRCSGVQDAIDDVSKKYNLEQERAEDGVTLGLLSERELSENELCDINEAIQNGFSNYLSLK